MGVRKAACWIAAGTGILARVCAAQNTPPPSPPPQPPAEPGQPVPQAPAAPAEPQQAPGPQQAPPTWTIELRGGAQIDFRADIDDSPGDVEIYRTGFG